MIKPIMKDILFLGQKCQPAKKEDLYIANDLRDTLQAHMYLSESEKIPDVFEFMCFLV